VNPITQGLLITAIGMGLVFVAILLLWALMDFLVRITNGKPVKNVTVGGEESTKPEPLTGPETKSQRLQNVASVAVAIAMSLQKQFPIIKPQDSGTISAWQSSRRSQVLNQSAALLNRKSRGTTK
jgi:Na+-transporting methylmalonyl-CoA/oxaloacetate decarboxylase gamma subunit